MKAIYDSCCYRLLFLYLFHDFLYDANFGVMALTSVSISNKIWYQQGITYDSYADSYQTNHFTKRTMVPPYIYISTMMITALFAKSKTIIDNDSIEDTKNKHSIDMTQQKILRDNHSYNDNDNDNDNKNTIDIETDTVHRVVVDTMTMKKAKWRKKRNILLKEIHDMTISNPSLAVEKASQTMERWWNMCTKLEKQLQQQQQSIGDDDSIIEKFDILYFRPTLAAYNLWIHAIAKSGMDNCGNEAERILKTVLPTNDCHLINQINVITYTNVMYAYTQQSKLNTVNNNNNKQNDKILAAQHAERILYEWLTIVETKQQQQQQSVTKTRSSTTTTKSVDEIEVESPIITSITCDIVLNAWAQQGTWDGAEHAEMILRRLEKYASETRGTTIGSNKKRRNNNSNNNNNAIRPTKHSYATVIHGWATCNGGSKAAERATRILDQVIRKCNSFCKDIDDTTIDIVVVVVPDTIMFNSCIHAWATSGDARAGNKALQLLTKMKLLYNSNNNNSILYNDCYPDTVTYNTVLSAWSHSGHINAAIVAEKVLQQMVSEYTNYTTTTTTTTNTSSSSYSVKGPVPAIPCTISYNTVLHAWSISQLDGAVQRAEDILNYMISRHRIEGTKCHISPDAYSFTSVLNAIAKSKIVNKAQRAHMLLETMLSICSSSTNTNNTNTDSGIKLSVIPFNAVINAAAFSAVGTTEQEKRTALQIAISTYKRLQNKQYININNHTIKPDSITYSTILKAIANLIPNSKNQIRNEMSVQIFTNCCQDGLVNDNVLYELHRAVQLKVLIDFIQQKQQPGSKIIRTYDGKIQHTDLPKSWSRNVLKKYATTSTSKTRTGTVSSLDLTTTTATNKIRRNHKSTTNDKSTSSTEVVPERKKQQQPTTLRRFRAMSEESYQSGKDL